MSTAVLPSPLSSPIMMPLQQRGRGAGTGTGTSRSSIALELAARANSSGSSNNTNNTNTDHDSSSDTTANRASANSATTRTAISSEYSLENSTSYTPNMNMNAASLSPSTSPTTTSRMQSNCDHDDDFEMPELSLSLDDDDDDDDDNTGQQQNQSRSTSTLTLTLALSSVSAIPAPAPAALAAIVPSPIIGTETAVSKSNEQQRSNISTSTSSIHNDGEMEIQKMGLELEHLNHLNLEIINNVNHSDSSSGNANINAEAQANVNFNLNFNSNDLVLPPNPIKMERNGSLDVDITQDQDQDEVLTHDADVSASVSADNTATACASIIPYDPLSHQPLLEDTNKNADTNPNSTNLDSSDDLDHDYIPHKGLINLGNTCYLNSALQMLMSIEGFTEDLIDLYQADLKNDNNDDDNNNDGNDDNNKIMSETSTMEEDESGEKKKDTVMEESKPKLDENENENENDDGMNTSALSEESTPMGQDANTAADSSIATDDSKKCKYPLRNALAKFFIVMKGKKKEQRENENDNDNDASTGICTMGLLTPPSYSSVPAIDPSDLKKVIDELSPLFVGFWQQDSHEFLSTILDLLHDEIENAAKAEAEEKADMVESTSAAAAAVTDTVSGSPTTCDENQNDVVNKTDSDTANTGMDICHFDHVMVERADADQAQEEMKKPGSESEENGTDSATSNSNSFLPSSADEEEAPVQQQSILASDYVLVDVNEEGLDPNGGEHDSQSIPKKARISSPETERLVEVNIQASMKTNTSSTICMSMSSNSSPRSSAMSKTSSFSDLGVDDIGELLHGKSDNTKSNSSFPGGLESASSIAGCKLVGGRIAPLSASISPSVIREAEVEEEDSGNAVVEDQPKAEATASSQEEVAENDSTSEDCPNQPQRTSTIVDEYFTMEVRTHLTCGSCRYSRSHDEMYRHLSIDVGPSSDDDNAVTTHHDRTVQEGLRKFFAPEKRELKCEKCFFESATQHSEIKKLPRALIVHLKRFIVDVSPDYSSVTYRKNQAEIELHQNLSLDNNESNGVLGDYLAIDTSYPKKRMVPLDDFLSIDDFYCQTLENGMDVDAMSMESEDFVDVVKTKPKYQIRSIVNHIGTSANCGHYTADALRPYEEQDTKKYDNLGTIPSMKWTRFNDSFVSRIRQDDAMGQKAQKTAYMVMYEFKDIVP